MMACNNLFRHSKATFSLNLNPKYIQNNSQCALKLIIKEVPSLKSYRYGTQHNYSTLLSSRQSYRNCQLYALSTSIYSKSFLSTNVDHDKYDVIVTNPSHSTVSSTEFSSGISKSTEIGHASSAPANLTQTVADVSEIPNTVASTDLLDVAVSLSDELTTAAQLVEPSFTSLGLANYTPVGYVQSFLEYLHIGCDMPWWLAIAASTVVVRILLIPIIVKTQRNAISMSNHMPQLQFLQTKFGEARKSGNTMEASRLASEMTYFMKEHNIKPLRNAMLPLMQAPVFISFFLALRGMAKVPVESMKYGGIWWATDLTIPDPYYIMPVIACGTLYVVLKVGAESGVKLENLKMAKYFVQALPVVALPFCMNFPAAVLYYWVTTNFCTLGIVSILKIKPVRQYLNLPTQQPLDPKFQLPKKGFISGVKEAYEDQKVLASIEDRRRIDDIRFLKAGTGPIPRTYSYDPTKPRPSNAASAISAKQHKT